MAVEVSFQDPQSSHSAGGPGGVQNEKSTGGGIDKSSMLATFCSLYVSGGIPDFSYSAPIKVSSDSIKDPAQQ